MKKNGFIATSILYSFFLVFITLFVVLIMNYLHNQVLIQKLDEASWNMLMGINNTKISDLKVGDHIKFANKAGNQYLNDQASWVVSYIEDNGATKKYYFLSDLDAQLLDVKYKLSTDKIEKYHAITIDVYKELKAGGAYTRSIQFPGINISIPTSSMLSKIRNQNIDEKVLNAILGIRGDYVVYVDQAISGYTTGQYYELRTYNFTNLKSNSATLLGSYCGGAFNGTKATYNANNTFGYMHVVHETAVNTRYVDYCAYASPIAYNHKASDLVVDFNESAPNDIVSTTYSSVYTLRLMADLTVNVNATNTYIAGGKGTSLDPYLLTNGVKQS